MNDANVPSENKRPFQFNLKTMLIVMTIICIWFVPGSNHLIHSLLDIVGYFYHASVPALLGVAIWKGRGWIRPFAICAIIPHIGTVGAVVLSLGSEPFPNFLATMFYGLIAGITGTAVYCHLERVDGVVPVPNLPILRDWFTNNESP